MMGHTHAITGACTGMAYASLTGMDTTTGITTATLAAYAALWPDIDHPHSHITHSLGPITRLLHQAHHHSATWAVRATATHRDTHTGAHRSLTHTVPYAALCGLTTGTLAHLTAPWGVWALAALAAYTLLRVLGWWAIPLVVGMAMGAHTTNAVAVGVAVGIGCLAHTLGDMGTQHGVPIAWPIPVGGKRWARITTPATVSTGGTGEQWVCAVLAVGTVAATPGLLW